MKKSILGNHMNRRFVLAGLGAAVLSLSLLNVSPAFADELDDLRVSGAVGEAFDGYARARAGSAKDFVKGVNAKRESIYAKRAQKEGVSTAQVGRVYAAQIIKKAPKGTYLLAEDGTWSQK